MVPEWEGLEPKEIVAAVRDAGVVGLGGAAFPTHVKLSPPEDKPGGRRLLSTAASASPISPPTTAPWSSTPSASSSGIRIMMHCLGVRSAPVIGIERNKPDAIEAIRGPAAPRTSTSRCVQLTVKYPQGAEKMLIKALLGREVPSGGFPSNVGVVVQNVASVATIAEVFETGLPLIERIVTVTGPGVRRRATWIVPVGTKLRDLLEPAAGLTDDAARSSSAAR